MAVDMFLKLDGIKGESIDDKHKEEIEVLSFSIGMNQSGSSEVGTGLGTGKVQVQDLTFTKYLDAASPNLMKWCCKGTHIKEGTFVARKAGGDQLEYYKIKMQEVLVSSVTLNRDLQPQQGGRLIETVTLNVTYFEIEYKPQLKDGKLGGPVGMQWNVKTNSEKKP